MTLPQALALYKRLAITPRRLHSRWDGDELVHTELPPHPYVVRRTAKRYLGVTPFYVAVKR